MQQLQVPVLNNDGDQRAPLVSDLGRRFLKLGEQVLQLHHEGFHQLSFTAAKPGNISVALTTAAARCPICVMRRLRREENFRRILLWPTAPRHCP
jgi:DNA-binding transcriptional LysR family regulator